MPNLQLLRQLANQEKLRNIIFEQADAVRSVAYTTLYGKPPTLVAEVTFGKWTRAGHSHIRHAVFRGLRADKEASMSVREKALRLPAATAQL